VAEDALYWQAVALARAGRSRQAIRAFEGFLGTYADSAHGGEASVMLGWLLLERGDREGAGRRFQAALDDRSPAVRRSAAEGLEAVRQSGN
jgi:TolA-binding protein